MCSLRIGLIAAVLLAAPAMAPASEHPAEMPALARTIPLDGLSGIGLVFAKTYNRSPWLYAVCCTATMAALGTGVAVVADVVLRALGIQVGKIEHKE